jgi:phenylalanyl-tRNA synthetase beta chain
MRVPVGWLREFVDVRVPPRELADALTLVGLAVDGIEGSGDAAVLDIDVTTNRVDCMNVLGVAREVAVIYGLPLRPLRASFAETGPAASQALRVEIEAPDLCTRFCARVLDVRLGPSPAWIRDRLESVGIRAINNVVDLSNYVMMEMGQPTHAFDLAKLPGGLLVARWAREGESLVTLDGVRRSLGPRNGVVAAGAEALAIAGVMGGAASEVSDETRTVALEAAHWEPLAVRRSAKCLGMHTEASHRFERGADPEGTAASTARLAHLLQETGAGSVRPGLIDVVARPLPAREARLRPSRANAILGREVPEERQRAILEGLGFGVMGGDAQAASWRIPSWRGDVSREVDLVEEVGRHFGIDQLPSTLPASSRAEGLREHQRRERLLRDLLTGAGLSEVINYDFVSSARAGVDPAPRVALANPLSSDQDVLRSSLTVPGLLQNLATGCRWRNAASGSCWRENGGAATGPSRSAGPTSTTPRASWRRWDSGWACGSNWRPAARRRSCIRGNRRARPPTGRSWVGWESCIPTWPRTSSCAEMRWRRRSPSRPCSAGPGPRSAPPRCRAFRRSAATSPWCSMRAGNRGSFWRWSRARRGSGC